MNEQENVWPDNLMDDLPSPPLEVLDRFAKLLGPKTDNVVMAEAVQNRNGSGSSFRLELRLRVPKLDNYIYTLLTLRQRSASGYPLDLVEEGYNLQPEGDLRHQEELEDYLRKVLASDRTEQLIKSLIAQAKYANKPDLAHAGSDA